MHYPMYTFSENVQRSTADLDLASLGFQACEEREREREREGGGSRGGGGGGGVKGSAHFALQILVVFMTMHRLRLGGSGPLISDFTVQCIMNNFPGTNG